MASVSFLCLSCAFFVEHILGFAPCLFCWVERGFYFALLLWSLSALRLQISLKYKYLGVIALLVLGLCANTWHVAIEYGWVSDEICAVKGVNYEEILESLKDLSDKDDRMPSCSEVPFYVLGLSMAEYNWLFMLFLVFLSFRAKMLGYECSVRKSKKKN